MMKLLSFSVVVELSLLIKFTVIKLMVRNLDQPWLFLKTQMQFRKQNPALITQIWVGEQLRFSIVMITSSKKLAIFLITEFDNDQNHFSF